MRKLMVLLAVVAIVVASMVVAPGSAQARMSMCEIAAGYGWHAGWANMGCYQEIMMDNWLLQNEPIQSPLPVEVPTAAVELASSTESIGTWSGSAVPDAGYAVTLVHLLL